MSGSKYFTKIAVVIIAITLVITVIFINGTFFGIESLANTIGYENRLFDNTKVHRLDIVMDNWDEFIQNAASEEYYTAAVVIDGESYKNVGIRGKGNTSLSNVASMGSDRYSFKIEFDHYDDSLTYHGLDKVSLNNLIQDSTMMKDYLTYTMMNEFGAAAPLCSFVYITVNGEDWGLYLAVEAIEDSFLKRNYGSDYGELYKPDSMGFGGGRGNGKEFDMEGFMNENQEMFQGRPESTGESVGRGSFNVPEMGGQMPDMTQMPDMLQMPQASDTKQSGENGASERFSPFGDMGGRGGGMGSDDVKLKYIDDNLDSYSNIWNNAKTDITEADQYRLIESLKSLSNGDEIESVVDIEQVIRYFTVHNYVCNGDSYTGSMIHNYYLYENDGRLSMIPWDYNLAYGTFQGGNAQSTVNTPIDSPVSGGSTADRPMIGWIFDSDEYTEMYHRSFEQFLETVDVIGIIDAAYELISPYVEKDPTAFYDHDSFEKGVQALKSFCSLRSESIAAQLESGETGETADFADASGLNLSDMGSMGMGRGQRSQSSFDNASSDIPQSFPARPEMAQPQQQTSNSPINEIAAETSAPAESEPAEINVKPNIGTTRPTSGETKPTSSTNPADETAFPPAETNQQPASSSRIPQNGMGFEQNRQSTSSSGTSGWIFIGISAIILCAGLIVAKAYRY